jgi:flagellar basal-body rod modification protein FlgD
MSRIPALLNTPQANQPGGDFNTLNDLDLDVFLKLLITELQNQDPLNPLDNSEMLAQINQIREIGATDKLTGTLDSVLLGQNIASSTNLIGADIDAVSDDNQRVSGTVTRVTIENGAPKLHLDLAMSAQPSIEKGDLEKGTYSYRVVWTGDDGALEGIELSGSDAVSTESSLSDYQSVMLGNLPITESAKQIYRTDSSGEGDYRLVATLTDGTQSGYRDTTGDGARSETRQTEPFGKDPRQLIRSFKVSLSNVSEIRSPNP